MDQRSVEYVTNIILVCRWREQSALLFVEINVYEHYGLMLISRINETITLSTRAENGFNELRRQTGSVGMPVRMTNTNRETNYDKPFSQITLIK